MARLGALYERVRDPHPTVFDALLVVAVAGVGVATELVVNDQVVGYRDGNAFSVGLALVAAAALAWRRTHPVVSLVVASAVLAVHGIHLFPGAGPFVATLAALYSVAAYGSTRAARWSLAVMLALQPLGIALTDDPNFDSPGDLAVAVVIFTAVWVWGDSRRMRRLQLAVVEERATRAERERDEQARVAVREERSRIAREMHDIVAHSVSVMVVQAGVARRMAGRDPVTAADAAGQVEATGRAALHEMRRVLGVLRADEGSGAADVEAPPVRAPQPGLAEVTTVVTKCHEAGLDVRVRTDGEVRPLPVGIELTAYRIIQEALTNTMKHAGPATAEVLVAYHDDALTVAVTDDGRGLGFDGGGAGHGLLGMQERVAVYGGDLAAGPHPGGGFRVRVRLPLDDAAVAAGPVG